MPSALAVTSLVAALLAASCSPHLATAPQVPSSPDAQKGFSSGIVGVDDQIVVTLAPGANAYAVAASYGATVVAVQQGFAVLKPAPEQEIVDVQLGMKRDARVLTVETNSMVLPAEARQKSWAFDDGLGSAQTFGSQPAIEALGIVQAHSYSRGQGVRVAVLDTGIDHHHPELAGRIAAGFDFIDNDPNPIEVRTGRDLDEDGVIDGAFGHGTHVAGIVMVTAPAAQLLVGRVLDAEGRGDVRTVAAGIRWAVSQGAQVINLSLGMLSASKAVSVALREANASGAVVVASAGNWGSDTPQEYPASSSNVIAVGASDVSNRPAPFTSYGAFVDICAPGVGIRSAYPGGGYRLWSGTSMSAPFVTGTVAAIKQQNPSFGMVDILMLLRSSAVPMVDLSPEQVGRLGAGGLNVATTMMALAGPGDRDDRPIGNLEVDP